MQPIYLNAILMDNGEIICLGKTIAWEKDVKKFVYEEVDEEVEGKTIIIQQIEQ